MSEIADAATMDMAEKSAQGRYAGDENLMVKFYKHPRPDSAATLEKGRPMFKDTDYISIMQPGNKDSIVIRPAMEMDKTRFAQHWSKYQARENQDDLIGTPLSEWGGLTAAQVSELKFMNVRSVEQLVSMTDTNAQGMMGINQLKVRAKRFLEGNDADKLATENAAQKELMASMQKRLDELEAKGKKPGRKKPESAPTEE